MRWHVFKRKAMVQWRRRTVRVCSAVFVLTVVIFVQYRLTKLPIAVDVEASSPKYSPATARVQEAAIAIHGPIVSSNNQLLGYDAADNQTVEFHATKARLSDETLEFLRSVVRGEREPPPSGFEQVDYFIKQETQQTSTTKQRGESPPADAQPDFQSLTSGMCRVFIRVYANAPAPSEITFYQPETGSQHFRSLEITAKDGDLSVYLKQDNANSEGASSPYGTACGKTLRVNEWSLSNYGVFDFMVVVAANSVMRFDFYTTDGKTTLDSGGRPFEPFIVGEQSLQAQGVSVVRKNPNDAGQSSLPTAFEARANKNGDPLRISSLKTSQEEMQLRYSGSARVKVNGEDVNSLSFFELVNGYPIPAALVGLANAALVGWLIRSVFGKRS